MKTILYRGKDVSTGKWIAGSLYIGINEEGSEYMAIITKTPTIEDDKLKEDNAVVFSKDEFHVVDKKSVGQYLMDDSDDIPIYEGDIVLQGYKVKTNNFYGTKTDKEVEIQGYHMGVAKLTPDGAQLCSITHFDKDGKIASMQPHKNKKIQIRTYRSKVIGNIIESPKLLKSTCCLI